ncbi:DUF257 domain-containing protein [Thermococcus argininiproducens]|uniref:DUF257 domain-containing protein n=1 Tax=Thermococcus argininiproducens TaxID=2866384 RepID=A0A9E7MCL8_9EURY|nr:DUF257 family protein [Thermococcus argininiproducens]USH00802.1 DUF257 domain-containing protein [Thermococcus argininiproducens]
MPTFLFMPEVEAVFEELRFGEGVLIEYNSLTHPDLLLYMLIQWAKKREYKVVVDDNLDTFYTFKTTLDLLGLNTRILEDILVIKTGGRKRVGNVIGQIPVNDVRVESTKYINLFSSTIEEGNVINPVLGLDRAFYIHSSKEEIMTLLGNAIAFKGDKRRIAFYFVNIDVLNKIHPAILSWLEELATTVIRIQGHLEKMKVIIIKSINRPLTGKEIVVSLKA